MEYITKKDLIDCSTPDEFCFSLCCMECKTVWKSTPIRFSRAGKKPENENRKIIYDTLYDREKNLAFQKAFLNAFSKSSKLTLTVSSTHAQYLRIFLGRHSVQAHTHASCFSLLRAVGAEHFMVMLRADTSSKNIFRL